MSIEEIERLKARSGFLSKGHDVPSVEEMEEGSSRSDYPIMNTTWARGRRLAVIEIAGGEFKKYESEEMEFKLILVLRDYDADTSIDPPDPEIFKLFSNHAGIIKRGGKDLLDRVERAKKEAGWKEAGETRESLDAKGYVEKDWNWGPSVEDILPWPIAIKKSTAQFSPAILIDWDELEAGQEDGSIFDLKMYRQLHADEQRAIEKKKKRGR